jgi:CRISPR-associated endonuclease Csn1
MKKILGLDLGTTSIGWAFIHESETDSEQTEIIGAGVRLVPLSKVEIAEFSAGQQISTNANRTLARSARRGLQRYKLRRAALLNVFLQNGWIKPGNHYAEVGSFSTHSTISLRAKAATEKIDFTDLLKVLMSINKKRGYKSSRKDKFLTENGVAIDAMVIAKELILKKQTPGQWVHRYFVEMGFAKVPDFYPSDLRHEIKLIIEFQNSFHPEIINETLLEKLSDKTAKTAITFFTKELNIELTENSGVRSERIKHLYLLRNKALIEKLPLGDIALILSEICGQISGSSGYLAAISDRSKQLVVNNQTVGQYMWEILSANSHDRTKGLIFYRQDYYDEFETIWNCQSQFHPELTQSLKKEIRDVIIFYQRKLRSQKHLISNCELEENRKCIPKSSPLFQTFRIWQNINNLEISDSSTGEKVMLDETSKNHLFLFLNQREKLKDEEVKKVLGLSKSHEINFKEIQGNRTRSAIIDSFLKICDAEGHTLERDFKDAIAFEESLVQMLLHFDMPPDLLSYNLYDTQVYSDLEKGWFHQLWHILYSAEEDQFVKKWFQEKLSFRESWSKAFLATPLETDFANLSAKAIKKILPFMIDGTRYDEACVFGGYNHSKSLTKEENDNRILIDRLPEIKKNSLRNPVVEKILNQMVNVVNAIADSVKYGKPDEIRIELARELKSNVAQRKSMTLNIAENTKKNELIKNTIRKEFGDGYVTRNNILRYKLWEECGKISIYTGKPIQGAELFDSIYDIDHIIPQSRLFDDSMSNKVLCERNLNIEKGNKTAYSFLLEKYGEDSTEFQQFLSRVKDLKFRGLIKFSKSQKLLTSDEKIPNDFVDRQLRETQYIAKKAKDLLNTFARNVVSTSGEITDKLRKDWGIEELLKELNLERYSARPDLISKSSNAQGRVITRIENWSKRDDHRHHAMDAITIALTKRAYIQYLNTLSAKADKNSLTYALENKYLVRDTDGKLKFISPIQDVRSAYKKVLEQILISHKVKSKVITKNTNRIKTKNGVISTTLNQGSVRGQLHLETVYSQFQRYETSYIKLGAATTLEQINSISNQRYRNAVIRRYDEYERNSKLAFGGKNSITKNPIYLDEREQFKIPEKLKITNVVVDYSIRKPVAPGLKLDKVIDEGIKKILHKRLAEFGGDDKKAFVNLDQNPIWLNREARISIKSVKIKGISNAISLHEKRDHFGNTIINNGKAEPTSWVNTGNNHHIAIYCDENGKYSEEVVSLLEAVTRRGLGVPIIQQEHPEKGHLVLSFKSNEMFLFPSETFDPFAIDINDPNNYSLIARHLYRVQKFSSFYYVFRHQYETKISNDKDVKDITFQRINSMEPIRQIRKIRINYIGEIEKEN